MRTNKIDALIYQLTSGKLKSDRAKILLHIKQQPLTIEKLVLLGYKIQTASARCSELEEMGLIQKMYNPSNSFSWFYYVEDKQKQKELREMILNVKKQRYFAKGVEMGYLKFDDNGQIIANFELIL